eukprot:858219-Prymnesium_polylepis.2
MPSRSIYRAGSLRVHRVQRPCRIGAAAPGIIATRWRGVRDRIGSGRDETAIAQATPTEEGEPQLWLFDVTVTQEEAEGNAPRHCLGYRTCRSSSRSVAAPAAQSGRAGCGALDLPGSLVLLVRGLSSSLPRKLRAARHLVWQKLVDRDVSLVSRVGRACPVILKVQRRGGDAMRCLRVDSHAEPLEDGDRPDMLQASLASQRHPRSCVRRGADLCRRGRWPPADDGVMDGASDGCARVIRLRCAHVKK